MDDITKSAIETAQTSTTEPEKPGTEQSTERARIYQKHYDESGVGKAEADAAVNEPVTTDATIPATESADATTTLSAQDGAPSGANYEDRFTKLETSIAQVAELLQKLGTPTAVTSPVEEKAGDFISMWRDGKIDEGVEILAKELEKRMGSKTVQAAAEQATQTIKFENEINTFIESIRSNNPELEPFEDMVAAKAQRLLTNVDFTSMSPPDGLKKYKEAVNAAVVETRKIVQQIRGAGKEEALTANKRVISSTPVSPTKVENVTRDVITPASELDKNKLETTDEYLAKRYNAEARRSGMAM
jgi:hypothetical protein